MVIDALPVRRSVVCTDHALAIVFMSALLPVPEYDAYIID